MGRMEETGSLIERVWALLGTSAPDAEDTLMDGYAGALALETERARLERRFVQLTGELDSERLHELESLRERISSTDDELSRLRAVLSAVRRHLAAASAAAAEGTAA
jgi:ABC-type phosphate transport system auxiliary subunit